ncbi:GPW/gp25 family protein [Myxococcus sp. RHSTA-1-4]|uniref:GPW/gp25 family protein n=1 Tax=Myxococcus sp. RHSTA-1-4 TaxID=2874601 RepID=UPI001CC0A9B5|nr:GPW/gp25 family protein [Myxococcus sp. RHSTA-1-4]MBZ4420177.1 GPW/gp25 family protein [Myxococcus sp. RHSTA-1-4]
MAERIQSIRFPFAVDESSGRLAEEPSYEAHVEQLIRQVLLTTPGERAHRPDFGCGLRRLVFAPLTDATAQLTRVMVLQALDRWLGSVLRVEEVQVRALTESLEVGISYWLQARGERRYLNLEVTL